MNENMENTADLLDLKVGMTAGDMLKNARTTGRRKREIQTIAKQLCIREEFLEALENGNYNVIPEQVYILGFARNYALELGLNPDEVVDKIKQEMGMVSDCVADDEDVSACAMPSIKEEHWFKVWAVKAYQFVYQHWVWFVGALAGIVVLFVLIAVLTPSKMLKHRWWQKYLWLKCQLNQHSDKKFVKDLEQIIVIRQMLFCRHHKRHG